MAHTEDNLVEALMSRRERVLGIMWHPERKGSDQGFDRKLIKRFFN